MAERDHRFTSAAAALDTFRRGSHGARWEAAAEYLIRNANTDTRMLLDYAIERTRRDVRRDAPPRRLSPLLLAAAVAGGALLVGLFVTLFVYILGNLRCG